MHILLGLVGLVGTIAFLLYRFSMMKQGADEVVDTVERAAGAWRRHKFRNRAERPALETEDDPRAAAAAIAVSVAESAGRLSASDEAAMMQEFETVMGAEESADLLSYARWLTKDVVDPNTVISRVTGLLNRELDDAQKQDLMDMLARLSSGDPAQVQAIGRLKTQLGI